MSKSCVKDKKRVRLDGRDFRTNFVIVGQREVQFIKVDELKSAYFAGL